MNDEKLIISYNTYSTMLEDLVLIIQNNEIYKELKYVHGIPRGGYPIAVHLSHFLNLELIDNMNKPVHEHTLIVDDIADTGITLEKYPHAKATATLFYKERSSVIPTFYLYTTDKWVVFPWEKIDEIPNRPNMVS